MVCDIALKNLATLMVDASIQKRQVWSEVMYTVLFIIFDVVFNVLCLLIVLVSNPLRSLCVEYN